MIKDDEKAELIRILGGGAYSEIFWSSRWHAAKIARGPSEEEQLQAQLRQCSVETVQDRRTARKVREKLNKLAGKRRVWTQAGYAQSWDAEQKRLDNLQAAAIYLHRANLGQHFYA